MLHHFYANPILLRPPIAQLAEKAAAFLAQLDVRCAKVGALTLDDITKHRRITLTAPFAGMVWKWGKLQERIETARDDEVDEGDLAAIIGMQFSHHPNAAMEIINTAACMLEDRLIKPAFQELGRGLRVGLRMPRKIAIAAYEGFAITLLHLVVLIAIGDGESAAALAPWCDLYLQGNFPLGIDDTNTFLFLTR